MLEIQESGVKIPRILTPKPMKLSKNPPRLPYSLEFNVYGLQGLIGLAAKATLAPSGRCHGGSFLFLT